MGKAQTAGAQCPQALSAANPAATIASSGAGGSHRRGAGRRIPSAGRADRVIKGVAVGNVWDELLQLALGLAGITVVQSVTALP